MIQVALILIAGIFLGSSVVINRLGIAEMPPLFFVFARLSVAAFAFAITLLILKRALPTSRKIWIDIAIVGITNAGIPLIFFTLALQFISSAVLTIFIALIPLFTALLGRYWLQQENLTRVKLLGLLLALGGVLFLIFTGTSGLNISAALDLRGQLLAFAGAIIGSISAVYTRKQLQNVDVIVVTAGQFFAGLVIAAPFAFFGGAINFAAITARGWFAVVYTGMIGSFLGFLFLFWMIKRYGATIAVLPSYVMPVVAAALGSILLGELITPSLIVGAALVLAGVFFVSR